MFAIFGLIGAAIGIMVSIALGELIFGLAGIALSIVAALFSLILGIISWLCPNFSLRSFPIKNPAETYREAKDVISFPPTSGLENNDGLMSFIFELCSLPMVFSGHRYAQKQIKILAEMDYPHCAALLGKIYKEGGGRKHNQHAAEWFQKAIEKRDTRYDVRLAASPLCYKDVYMDYAELYLYGKGVPQDFNKCLSLLDKSAFAKTEEANNLRILANWKLKQ